MTPDQERALDIGSAVERKTRRKTRETMAYVVAAEILRAEARGMHRVLFGVGLENPEDRLATLEAQAAELEHAK